MKYLYLFLLISFFVSGCASSSSSLFGSGKLDVPPEFNQKVQLIVSDDYNKYQATLSKYDLGDLQSFHSQHTFSIKIVDAFKQMFDSVEKLDEPRIMQPGDVEPATFEVKITDLGHDWHDPNVDSYRGEVTIAAAMTSARGNIIWQKAFLGKGYVRINPEFESNLGPDRAVQRAVNDAIEQMQDEIIKDPQIRLQLLHYKEIEAARRKTEIPI